MKVVMTGTSSVGKTTLIDNLHIIFEIPKIQEMSRTVIRQFGKLSPKEISDPEEMKQFQIAIMNAQAQAESQMESFLSDRTYVDFVSYASLFIPDKAWLSYYDELCYDRFVHANYDIVFYIPPTIKNVPDSVRYDENVRAETDRLVRDILERWKVPYIEVVPINLNDRIEFCQQYIKSIEEANLLESLF